MLKYCTYCGSQINKDKKFCTQCGKTIEKKSIEKIDDKKIPYLKSDEKETPIKKKKVLRYILPIVIIAILVTFLAYDIDGDELNNFYEIMYGTDMIKTDTDQDNVLDYDEIFTYKTNPKNDDTDDDGINDGSEIINYKTNPLKDDSDDDGLNDYKEIKQYKSNPLKKDTDNDGLNDDKEIQIGTDILDSDTDDDGKRDGVDTNPKIHDWKLIDSDNDGWNDYKEEYEKGTDRFNSDTDNDGYKDSSDPHPLTHEWKFLDSDNDGWDDYKEFYEENTNRYNSDTDGDGAPDPQDAHPLSSSRTLTVDFEWHYPNDWFNSQRWTWTIKVSNDLYLYKQSLPRIYWKESLDYTNDPVTKQLATGLKNSADDNGYDYYETANFILSFVQSLPYTSDDATTGYNDYPRYPIETLVDRGGDCEDTSFLFAGILKELDYDVYLVSVPRHVAVAVYGSDDYPGTYYTKNGNHYYYCETTGEGREMGDMPSNYEGVDATLIKVN